MAILEKEVLTGFNARTINYFEKLGYEIPRYKDKWGSNRIKRGTKITVKVEDLPVDSHINVTKICDDCGEYVEKQPYKSIVKSRINGDGKDRCLDCGIKKRALSRRNNVKYENSLHYFLVINESNLNIKYSNKNKRSVDMISIGSKYDYVWECLICESLFTMSPESIKRGSRCPYCSGHKVNNTNCLSTTHPEIANLLVDNEIGYKVSKGSSFLTDFKCERCEKIIEKIPIYRVIKQGFACPYCSDGISYPEKFMMNLLKQLNLKFEKNAKFNWCKNIKNENDKLSGDKLYDFYIPSLNCIIETHGGQHYKEGWLRVGGRTLEEEQENDRLKEKLAKENGIKNYIVINCRLSELDYIKRSIANSQLSKFISNSDIDWLICHEFACKSIIYTVCKLARENFTHKEISKYTSIHYSTVLRYLKLGEKLGLCRYEPHKNKKIHIIQLDKDDNYIKEWTSISEASKQMNYSKGNIIKVCKGDQKSAHGYNWMYKKDYDRYIEEKNKRELQFS